jgi:quinoprotein glucose dehydrogenase
MPSFSFLSEQQIAAIVAYVRDTTVQPQHEVSGIPENNEPFGFDGYNFYLDSNNDPAIKPPFGTMTAINLNTGEIAWQVPLGEYEKFKKKGIANTGSFNRGGGIATAGGLIFIGATEDGKFRAFDQHTGKILWEYQLPGMASSIPSTYSVNGKQYVVVAVSGNEKFKGGYVAFALP